MITERTLRKWRREALKDAIAPQMLDVGLVATYDGVDEAFYKDDLKELANRILKMTQELLDQHLLNKEKS